VFKADAIVVRNVVAELRARRNGRAALPLTPPALPFQRALRQLSLGFRVNNPLLGAPPPLGAPQTHRRARGGET
jgi:hypothetical protein